MKVLPILIFCVRMGKPKKLHELNECNVLSFAQAHENEHMDRLHQRVNRWLRDSSNSSRRYGWGARVCCACLHAPYISDYDLPEPELEEDLLPCRDSDVYSE